jgi:hypothetical protein
MRVCGCGKHRRQARDQEQPGDQQRGLVTVTGISSAARLPASDLDISRLAIQLAASSVNSWFMS